MNRTFRIWTLSALVSALAACGGGDHDAGPGPTAEQPAQPKVAVQDLPTGTYVVSLGDASAPTVGKYYAAEDGSRLLAVADGTDRADRLYRRSAQEAWVAVPPSATDVSVTLLRSDAIPATTPAPASLAGTYVALVSAGTTARLSVNASGDITAGASACKLSGKLAANALPGTMKATLAMAGCGALPASSTGVATFDKDYLPAKFRLLSDDGIRAIDLWAFAE